MSDAPRILRSLFSEAIRKKRQQPGFEEATFDDFADQLNISKARLSSYHTGNRIPPDVLSAKMADFFFTTEKERNSFVRGIKEARAAAHQESGSLLEKLASKEKQLRIGTLKSGPLCGAERSFFDRLFDRFFHLSGLATTREEPENLDLAKTLWSSKLDLVYPYLASVGRVVLIHFWPTPIRLSLGAVIPERHGPQRGWVEEVLAGQVIKTTRIKPVVIRGEVGYIHCHQTLKYADKEMIIADSPSPLVLAKLMMQHRSPSEVPVVVTDEYVSLQVLKALAKSDARGIPVIKLSTRANAQAEGARRELPQYFASFATSRRQRELQEMITQAFQLFLATEIETTSTALADLYTELMKEVVPIVEEFYTATTSKPNALVIQKAECFREAHSWALYTLALDQESIKNYPRTGMPWGPILERARYKVQERLGRQPERINEQIDDVVEYDKSGRPLSDRQFRSLCKIFDVDLSGIPEAEREYIYEDRDVLVTTLQSALKGDPIPPLEPKTGIVDPTDPKAEITVKSVLYGSLWELLRMYTTRDFGKKNPASKELEKILQPQTLTESQESSSPPEEDEQERVARKFKQVVIAWHGRHHTHYIGCACLIPRPTTQTSSVPEDLELRYTWVTPNFRRLGIGQHIIYAAHEYAKEKRYKYLIVQVLPVYFEGLLFFEKRGFTRRKQKGDENRVVLEYSVEKPFPPPPY